MLLKTTRYIFDVKKYFFPDMVSFLPENLCIIFIFGFVKHVYCCYETNKREKACFVIQKGYLIISMNSKAQKIMDGQTDKVSCTSFFSGQL